VRDFCAAAYRLTAWLAERLKEEIAEVEKQHDEEVGLSVVR
jgi:hypothetical protein